MPKEARAVKTAKSIAIHFHPSPRSKACMGPPSILPLLVLMRYFTAKSPSAYFVEIPKTPVSQHHSTAPGPPMATAVATPMMLPVPIVAANAVAKAPNCDTSPVASGSFFTDSLMAVKILRCGKRRRMVRKMWVPNSRIIIGHPQRKPLTCSNMSFSVCIIISLFPPLPLPS